MWQSYLTLLSVLLIHSGAIIIVLILPCEESLFLGACGFGRAVLVGILASSAFIYGIVSRLLRNQSHLWLVITSIIFALTPVLMTLSLVRSTTSLQPYALESLRSRGYHNIHFLDFLEEPQYDSQQHLVGIILQATITVEQSGNYTIHPMQLDGHILVDVHQPGNQHIAQPIRMALEAGRPYTFKYVAWIAPPPPDEAFPPSNLTNSAISWKALWRIDSYPPFPLYLLGIGSVAQVYPESTPTYPYLTHIDPRFQTRLYPANKLSYR